MKLPDWLLSTKCFLPMLAASIAISPYSEALAQVYVHGYTKKDGTYVSPHMRSSPGSYGGGSSYSTPSSYSYQPSLPSGYMRNTGTSERSYQRSSPDSYGGEGPNSGTQTSQGLTGCRVPSNDEIKRAAKGMRVEISGGDCIFIINPKSQDRYRW